MKKIITIILLLILSFSAWFFYNNGFEKNIPKPKPLLVYTFENLKKTASPKTQIIIDRKVDEAENSLSHMFYIENVSGLMNIPKKPGVYPVIIMIRGYVPKEIYRSGVGTESVAKELAKNGFITLAPDFLGYGESASASADSFEDRFQTYTTVLTLLSSLKTLNLGAAKADLSKVGLWGHSNGGHIALSVLAISGAKYPTVLWAPVSKSFPYSILYYTDETDDQGKALRKALADFEEDYDTEKFSPLNYYSWIKAPVEIHQGENDREVPVWWSDDLVETLKKDKIDVTYLTYPNSDHNLLPDGWSKAAQNTIDFYNKYFK